MRLQCLKMRKAGGPPGGLLTVARPTTAPPTRAPAVASSPSSSPSGLSPAAPSTAGSSPPAAPYLKPISEVLSASSPSGHLPGPSAFVLPPLEQAEDGIGPYELAYGWRGLSEGHLGPAHVGWTFANQSSQK